MKSALGLVAASALLLQCGGGQTRVSSVFVDDWQDDGGKSIHAIQERVARTAIPKGADVAVGVTDDGLVGTSLSGGTPWTFKHAIDGRPAVAGSVVVGTGNGEIFLLDATTGRALWTRRAGGMLRGAGDDGQTTVISLSTSGDNASTVLALDHNGNVIRQIEVKPSIGVPAVAGNYAFLPWQNQYVTVYDLSRGEETARALFREQVSRAFTEGGRLYFGEVGLFRFDEHIDQASANKASHVTLPTRELPGTPKWFNPGADVLPAAADARDKIQLFARPLADGDLAIDSGRFVATYFRIAVGLDAKSGALAWAHVHPTDIIGAAAYEGGVALCDGDGTVTFVGTKSGTTAGTISLGKKVKSCVVQADTFSRTEPSAAKPLVEQLSSAIVTNDPEMVMIERVLLRELARLPEELATKVLVDMASNPSTAPMLLADARNALAGRRNGASYMIDALGRHYDFLKDVLVPPPVGPIADALAGMKEKRAASALAQHLSDPADTPDDVKRVAHALVELGGKDEVPALKTFFALYRTTPDDEDVAAAVVSAAEALLAFGGTEGQAAVAKGAEDPPTPPTVRPRLASLLEAHPATPVPAGANTAAATTKH